MKMPEPTVFHEIGGPESDENERILVRLQLGNSEKIGSTLQFGIFLNHLEI